jgi:DNA repair protein SbcD/Mre11
MRFIHTADWHLGRQLHNFPLLEDQRYVLRQLVDLAADASVDAFIIAGDVYDRAVPAPDAVELLDETLAELVLARRIPVIIIAGNHDSGRRLGFASRLLAQSGVHLYGQPESIPRPLTLGDRHGPVHFFGLPYVEPAVLREKAGEQEIQGHAQAIRWLTDHASAAVPAGERSVCVAHCFVAGGAESESERPLSVGGTAAVSAESFASFSYTALGHLHRPQDIGERLHYSGSLLKYSFSEIDHRKSANLVELDAEGIASIERVPLVPMRDLRLVEGKLAELLRGPADGENPSDFLLARLTDGGALLEPMRRLREVYPNVLHIERPVFTAGLASLSAAPHGRGGDAELFAMFFEQVTGLALDERRRAAFAQVLEEVSRHDREAGP